MAVTLAARLLASGNKVRVINRSAERLVTLVANGAEPLIVRSALDEAAMTQAFQGAIAVYTMVTPTKTHVPYADAGHVLGRAASKANVSYVVNLSAIGAHLQGKGGHVGDYYYLEEALNNIDGLNVMHLRPGFFMTSFYSWIDQIIAKGQVRGLFRGDLAVPRIASSDIGAIAADELMRLNFKGVNTRELHGQRDISMNEAADIIVRLLLDPHPFGSSIARPRQVGRNSRRASDALRGPLLETDIAAPQLAR
jgi:uncharacterized protein YbjT (DUF2867 family)